MVTLFSSPWTIAIIGSLIAIIVVAIFRITIVRLIANWRRRIRRPMQAKFFSHKREDGLYVILSALPYKPPTRDGGWALPSGEHVADIFDKDFQYVLGYNEVEFLLETLPALGRLVPYKIRPRIEYAQDAIQRHPHPLGTRLKDEIVESNMIVFGSSAYNEVTELIQTACRDTLRFSFPHGGGKIIDKRTGVEYGVEQDSAGEVIADHGIIAKVWSPWNEKKTIFVAAGVIHLFQEGLTTVFRDKQLLQSLMKEINAKAREDMVAQVGSAKVKHEYWEAIIRQEVVGRQPTNEVRVVEASVLLPKGSL